MEDDIPIVNEADFGDCHTEDDVLIAGEVQQAAPVPADEPQQQVEVEVQVQETAGEGEPVPRDVVIEESTNPKPGQRAGGSRREERSKKRRGLLDGLSQTELDDIMSHSYYGRLRASQLRDNYGFIDCKQLKEMAQSSRDVFVHKNELRGSEFREGILPGTALEFRLSLGSNGQAQAVEVKALTEEDVESRGLDLPQPQVAEPNNKSTHHAPGKLYFGVVKMFNSAQGRDGGYGFITCTETMAEFGRDVFVHRNQVTYTAGRRELEEGMRISFEVQINDKGMPQARNVRVLDGAAAGTPDLAQMLMGGRAPMGGFPAAGFPNMMQRQQQQQQQGQGQQPAEQMAAMLMQLLQPQPQPTPEQQMMQLLASLGGQQMPQQQQQQQQQQPGQQQEVLAALMQLASDPAAAQALAQLAPQQGGQAQPQQQQQQQEGQGHMQQRDRVRDNFNRDERDRGVPGRDYGSGGRNRERDFDRNRNRGMDRERDDRNRGGRCYGRRY